VRQALAAAVPPERTYRARATPRLDRVRDVMDRILDGDLTAPRKQRHTARRIHDRLRAERPAAPVAASTVRAYVRAWKEAHGLLGRTVCVPQTYAWGQDAQVDWYEAVAILGDERVTLQVFCLRSMASGAAFHRAYPRATQQAFLEAHEGAFAYFGGVFATLRYDNLSSAVRKILRGFRREETTRFLAFRSHWQFDAAFCTPGEGHEKGGVEGEVGYFRRNHWVPVPQAADLDALNAQLLAGCRADEARMIHPRTHTVGEAVTIERASLRSLADEPFDLQEVSFPQVDGAGCVRVKTNPYSVPAAIGTTIEAKLGSAHVELWAEGQCLARHERSYGRFVPVLDLEHYLDVLVRKPGALAGSTPLAQCRARGLWPASYDTLWAHFMRRHGKQAGTREMIGVLQLARTYGPAALHAAIEATVTWGGSDQAAVRQLLQATGLERPALAPMPIGPRLAPYHRPPPSVAEYDTLLSSEAGQ
jgi:transposase